jgi:hypothetical protein
MGLEICHKMLKIHKRDKVRGLNAEVLSLRRKAERMAFSEAG